MRTTRRLLAGACAASLCAVAIAQPVNDACSTAPVLNLNGFVAGSVAGATSDGSCSCSPQGVQVPDTYHRFTSTLGGLYTFSLCNQTSWDTVVSVHSGCPATALNQLACDDDLCRPSGAQTPGWPSSVTLYLPPETSTLVRVSGYDLGAEFNEYRLESFGPAIPTGACCVVDVCSVETRAVCDVAGGVYRGDYTACQRRELNPRTFVASGLPLAIPDAPAAGLSRTITIADAGLVAGVEASLLLAHDWAGDLIVTLTHDGKTAVLLHRLRGGLLGTSINVNGLYTFSDNATISPWSTPEVIADDNTNNTLTPALYWSTDQGGSVVSLAQVFAGSPIAGDWRLDVVDTFPGSAGVLNAFELGIDPVMGVACDAPPPTGACCLASDCTVTSQAGCQVQLGTYRGVGTLCGDTPTNPTTCCPANFNSAGGVSVQDIFDFLQAWFSAEPTADFNNDINVTVQDIFDFLSAWFVGCRVL